MITQQEITRSLRGAWGLIFDRPDALDEFDTSYEGFWRSFQAFFLILPFFVITSLATRPSIMAQSDFPEMVASPAYLWARFLALALDWITLPLLLAVIAKPLGVGHNYVRFVVVRNWAAVLMVIPYTIISVIEFLLGGTGALGFMPSLIVLVAVLWYAFIIARKALDAPVGMAIGLVVLDVFLSMFLDATANRLFGLPPLF